MSLPSGLRPIVSCLVAAWLTFQPGIVDAQGVLTLSVGSGPISVAPGSVLVVPLTLDMSAAAGANVAALTTGITWGPARLTLDSVRPGTLGTPTVNTAAASSGSASLSIFNAVGATTTQTVAQLYFTTQGQPGGTRIALAPTVAANETGATVLAQLFTRPLDVCIGQGLWGDVTGDNAVNIIDAQQIARYSVGLSVLNPTVLTTVGDVNADNSVNIIDAQQLARFSVGLSSAARVNTPFNPTPSVASVTMSPTVAALTVGQRVQVTGTPRDSTGADIAGCTAVTYVSSAPLIASVNGFGLVTAIGSGTANIIASAGARSAQSSITIGGGAGTPVLTLSPSSLLFNGVVAGTNPPSQAVTITNGGTGTLSGLSLGSVVYGGAATGWLQLSSLSATSAAPTATFSVQPLIASLPAGTYSATVPVLSAVAGNSPQSVSVSLTITAPAIASVTVSPSSAAVPLGLTQPYTAIARDAQGNVVPGASFSWTSSNSTIATVATASGIATAVAIGGPVVITAFANGTGLSGTAQLAVTTQQVSVQFSGTAPAGAVVQDNFNQSSVNCSFSAPTQSGVCSAASPSLFYQLIGSGDANTLITSFNSSVPCVQNTSFFESRLYCTLDLNQRPSAQLSVTALPAISSPERIAYDVSEASGTTVIHSRRSNGTDLWRVVPGLTARLRPGRAFLAYVSGDNIEEIKADGDQAFKRTILSEPANSFPRLGSWSSDGQQIVYSTQRDAGNREIYRVSRAGGAPIRLTNAAEIDQQPDWSSGNQIVWVRSSVVPSNGPNELRIMNGDGTGATLLLATLAASGPRWSPDATRIAFAATSNPGTASASSGIWIINANGTGLTKIFDFPTPASFVGPPVWSPDGTALAFMLGRDLYVGAFVPGAMLAPTRITTTQNINGELSWR